MRIFHRPTALSLRGPAYTDAAVEHVCRLTNLEVLTLDHTAISEQGFARLRRELPRCRIERLASWGSATQQPREAQE